MCLFEGRLNAAKEILTAQLGAGESLIPVGATIGPVLLESGLDGKMLVAPIPLKEDAQDMIDDSKAAGEPASMCLVPVRTLLEWAATSSSAVGLIFDPIHGAWASVWTARV